MKKNTKLVKGYCVKCWSLCPTISVVEDGIFKEVYPDKDHPNAIDSLCPKGLAAPELVYSKDRLRYPMRRTNSKEDPDPGWKRITWDEALEITAAKLNEIKENDGPEAVAFYCAPPAGSQAWDFISWAIRLSHAFGTPNHATTTHVCQWSRDALTAYTYGTGLLDPEVDKSSCILLWGQNPYNTWRTLARDLDTALERKAKLIVVDPRRTKLAEKADCWLQVLPGTDAALALGLLNVLLTENLFDEEFALKWTTAPFLIRSDTQDLLKASDVFKGADTKCNVIWDQETQSMKIYNPSTVSFESENARPVLFGEYKAIGSKGETIECKTAFQLFKEHLADYTPEKVEKITRVSGKNIRKAARLFATVKPACYYTWSGIEQQANSNHTNRAISLLYILTGNFDVSGSNRFFPRIPINAVNGYEFVTPAIEEKRLGGKERPLGPPGSIQPFKVTRSAVRANDFYNAVLHHNPYPIKALVGLGGNIVMGNPDSLTARQALKKLDFYVQTDLFMTPSARFADIVLPAASFWETWYVRAGFRHNERAGRHIQLREAVVPPQHESKSDIQIIFELAEKLGLKEKFWNGDIEEAINYQIAPAGVTVKDLKKYPGGITLDITVDEKHYAKINPETGVPFGFNTPSRKVEIYLQLFKDYGYEPLPIYEKPGRGTGKDYPLIMTCIKLHAFSHTRDRNLPSLRRLIPEPYVEIHPARARELSITEGDWIIIETEAGSMSAKAKLTDMVDIDVVCTQHGWWQECPELGLPGYDPYSENGSNIQLLISSKMSDPIMGSYQLKGIPCNIKKR